MSVALLHGCATTAPGYGTIKLETLDELYEACGKSHEPSKGGTVYFEDMPKTKLKDSNFNFTYYYINTTKYIWPTSNDLRCNWGSQADVAELNNTIKPWDMARLCTYATTQRRMIKNANGAGINTKNALIELNVLETEANRRGKFTKREKQLIANEDYEIGMKEKALICSKGMPDDINSSVGGWGVHSQYVYRDAYIYVENGRVTSWQN